MNKARRKRISEISENLQDVILDLEGVLNEEQEAFDNLPEGLQESERGMDMEDNVSTLEGVIDALNEQVEELENI